MGFAGRTVLITGASDGIGAELARQLAPERPRLVLAARRAEALESVADACRALGAEALAVVADVAVEADCERLVRTAVERFGGVDVLVANAGVSMHAAFDAITDFSTYERLWRVNCLGTIACVRHAWPHLKASRGQIVGVSSLLGRVGMRERSVYCTSKFAQTGFLEALRPEAAEHGIAVTVVYPGVVAPEIRRRGLKGDGTPAGVSGLEESGAMPVDVCAHRIVHAMRRRRREDLMTTQGRVAPWLRLLAPGVLDRLASRALAKRPTAEYVAPTMPAHLAVPAAAPVAPPTDTPPSPMRRLNAVAAEGAIATVLTFAPLAAATDLGALSSFGIAASVGTIAMLVGMSVPWPRPPVRPGLARLGGRLAAAGNVAFLVVGVFGSVAFADAGHWLAWLAPGAAIAALGLAALHLAARR